MTIREEGNNGRHRVVEDPTGHLNRGVEPGR
jgi:hypothetical protein